jgi:hypothetical protein
MSGMGNRLTRLEAALAPPCPGPPLTIQWGQRARPGATPPPGACPFCGRPPAAHRDVLLGIVFVDSPREGLETCAG